MTDTLDNDHAADDPDASGDAPSPGRRRFDPRLAIIYTVGAFVIVLAFAVVMGFVNASKTESTTSETGDISTMQLKADDGSFTATTLPPSGLLTMDGEVTDLANVVEGKPTMLNMFSSACVACRTEMPALERLHNAAGDEFQVVGVNLGDSESITRSFVKQTGVSYEIVRDPKLLLVSGLNITAQPMTLWVDAKGKIIGHRYGELSDAEMRVAVQDYLGIQVPKA
ncbi:MAG TPA: TlpA disulfide reductase family protein [Acidimicrobiales bacterium]|nr:TlpA disulfide reductase family protein [Acidimicrobiales bacterium]